MPKYLNCHVCKLRENSNERDGCNLPTREEFSKPRLTLSEADLGLI